MKHILEADSIQLELGLRPILSDIHIQCETGKITGLLGRNGQGKSCLLRILYGDLPAASRSIRFDQVSEAAPYKRPDWLLYLPQFNIIPGSLTVRRVLEDFCLDFRELKRRFPEFGPAYRSRIRELSGGERRLIHLYVMVRSPTRFVLLDEPFTHLMPIQIEKVKEMLLEEKENKGLLITDHMYRHVTGISDQVYVLADGTTHLTKTDQDLQTLGFAKL